MTALLRMDGVTLVRGGRMLVEGFDLALAPGDGVVLTGPNGSGKSSLLRLAAGLLDPAAGTVARGTVALADDNLALDRDKTLGAAITFWTGDAAALEPFGLAHLAGVPVRHLSAGQRRRASLARVVASRASLWLLDEPGNGLDREGSALLDRAIAAHRAEGGAVLAASHGALGGAWTERSLNP